MHKITSEDAQCSLQLWDLKNQTSMHLRALVLRKIGGRIFGTGCEILVTKRKKSVENLNSREHFFIAKDNRKNVFVYNWNFIQHLH